MYVSQIICSSLREKKHTVIFSIKNKFFSSLLAYHYCSISLLAQVYLLDFFSVCTLSVYTSVFRTCCIGSDLSSRSVSQQQSQLTVRHDSVVGLFIQELMY